MYNGGMALPMPTLAQLVIRGLRLAIGGFVAALVLFSWARHDPHSLLYQGGAYFFWASLALAITGLTLGFWMIYRTIYRA